MAGQCFVSNQDKTKPHSLQVGNKSQEQPLRILIVRPIKESQYNTSKSKQWIGKKTKEDHLYTTQVYSHHCPPIYPVQQKTGKHVLLDPTKPDDTKTTTELNTISATVYPPPPPQPLPSTTTTISHSHLFSFICWEEYHER